MIQFTIDEINEQKREPLQKQHKMELVYTILSNKEMKLIPICKGRLKEMLLKLHFKGRKERQKLRILGK